MLTLIFYTEWQSFFWGFTALSFHPYADNSGRFQADWHAALAIVTSAGELDWNKRHFPPICPAAGKPYTGLFYAANDLVGRTAGAQRTWGCCAKPVCSDGAGVRRWNT
ncbi:hypothetical protein F2P79_023851 [Pimephales promelas]|nr:hypothetical protein F2P79_023851 [Pimephales promelas]